MTLQSKINDSAYNHSEEDDAESDPNSDPKIANHTSDRKKIKFTDTATNNGNYPQKLLINWTLPMIIVPIDPKIADGVADGRGTTHALQTHASKVIIADTARSGARILRNPGGVSWTDRYRTTPQYGNTSISSPRLTYPVLIGGGTIVSPTSTGSQYIINLRGSISPQEVRDAQPLDTSINEIYSKHRDPTSTWSKVIGRKFSDKSSSNV